MRILIDTQERKKVPFVKAYYKRVEKKLVHINGFRVQKLDAGDYATEDGLIGIERKADDLLPSVINKKLKQQLKELRDNFQYPFLFVEFDSIDDACEHYNIKNTKVIGMVASCLIKSKVPWVWVGNYFVPTLFKTMEKAYEFYDEGISYTPIRKKATKKQKTEYLFKQSIPNISSVLGQRLYEHFDGNYKNFVNSNIDELQKIKGIGKEKANEIFEIFNDKEGC